jgi:hypothetical protein
MGEIGSIPLRPLLPWAYVPSAKAADVVMPGDLRGDCPRGDIRELA